MVSSNYAGHKNHIEPNIIIHDKPYKTEFMNKQKELLRLQNAPISWVENTISQETQPTKVNTSKICRFYQKGTCRHGLKGQDCKFSHPKPCKKLMTHGTKASYGCNLGKKCSDFTPKYALTQSGRENALLMVVCTII